MGLLNFFYRRKLNKYGIKVNAIKHISGELICEAPASLSNGYSSGRCRLGAFSYIGRASQIRNANIGRYCSVGKNVTIGAFEHPKNWLTTHIFAFDSFGPFNGNPLFEESFHKDKYIQPSGVVVGNDAWIGDNAFIKSGVTIHNGAIIAAGAVVTKSVAPYAIVAGAPAKVIGMRFSDDVIKAVEASEWWQLKLLPEYSIDMQKPLEALNRIKKLKAENKIAQLNHPIIKISSRKNKTHIKKDTLSLYMTLCIAF